MEEEINASDALIATITQNESNNLADYSEKDEKND